jgi:hypothetical protein
MWFEPVLLSNRLARTKGGLVSPFEAVQISGEFSIGHQDTGVDLEWDVGRTLLIRPVENALRFQWANATRSVVLNPGQIWNEQGVNGPILRVLTTPHETCGWPAEVAAPLGPWDDDLLSVLADSLLEAGYPGGSRLIQKPDALMRFWLPALTLLPAPCIELSWRRGVVDELKLISLRGAARPQTWANWAMGRSLAGHLVAKPMRALSMQVGWDERHDVLRFVAGLSAGGGLPCLATLRCTLHAEAENRTALREFEGEVRRLPGLTAGLPSLQRVELDFAKNKQ